MKRLLVSALFVALISVPVRAEGPIQAHKDRLFAYPTVLGTSDRGAHVTYDYREARDINGRDAIPERRVKGNYVSLGVRSQQADLSLDGLAHVAVGRGEGASVIVLYLHGQGGSRKQGVDDFTFGGNFNRVKNLVVGSGGLYISPDFPDFGEGGAAAVGRIIAHYAARSPKAPVIVACGSMGGALCWELAERKEVAARLGGLALLGSHWDDGFLTSAAFRRKVPVVIAHGSRDKVFPIARQEEFFRSIRAADGTYPIRFLRFEDGTHGTPIRMIDWRDTLNWMLGRTG